MTTNPTPPAITLEWITEQEAFHKRKLAGLAALKSAFLSVLEPEPGVGHEAPVTPKPVVETVTPPTPAGSKKWNCLNILGTKGPLMTAEVVAELNNRGFTDSNQPNTSPQLSLYKMQGLIGLHGSQWSLTAKGQQYLVENKI